MSLETDIQAAYEEQEAVETAARKLELVSAVLKVLQASCQHVLTVNPLIATLSLSR